MDFDADYSFIGNEGSVFWFKTDHSAPRNRVIALSALSPAQSNWVEVLPESDTKLNQVSLVNDILVTEYLEDARSVVRFYSLEGKLESELELPGIPGGDA